MVKNVFEGKAKYASVTVTIETDFFSEGNATLENARHEAVEAMADAWAEGTKAITKQDWHIDTAAYINSIGYATNYTGPSGSLVGPIIEGWTNFGKRTRLKTGSGVPYAIYLEKRYNIYARGLENSMDKMASKGLQALRKVLSRK